jgi:hypothetical protein
MLQFDVGRFGKIWNKGAVNRKYLGSNGLDNPLTAVRLAALRIGRALFPETLFFSFRYSFLLEAKKTTGPSAAVRIRQTENIRLPHRVSNPRASDIPACNSDSTTTLQLAAKFSTIPEVSKRYIDPPSSPHTYAYKEQIFSSNLSCSNLTRLRSLSAEFNVDFNSPLENV